MIPFGPLEAEAAKQGCIARTLGISDRDVTIYRTKGLTIDQADRMAGRLHKHPTEIWPDWYTHDLFDRLNSELVA